MIKFRRKFGQWFAGNFKMLYQFSQKDLQWLQIAIKVEQISQGIPNFPIKIAAGFAGSRQYADGKRDEKWSNFAELLKFAAKNRNGSQLPPICMQQLQKWKMIKFRRKFGFCCQKSQQVLSPDSAGIRHSCRIRFLWERHLKMPWKMIKFRRKSEIWYQNSQSVREAQLQEIF